MAKGILFFEEDVKIKLPKKKIISDWLNNCAINEQYNIKNLNIIFCKDAYLLKINTSFLNHDTYTDIITFDYTEDNIINGEIYISIERVNENSKIFNTEQNKELLRVVIHGLLHLCGYSDAKPEEKSLMTEKENYYLSLLEI